MEAMKQDIKRLLDDNNNFSSKLCRTSSSLIFKIVVNFDFTQSHRYPILAAKLIADPLPTLKTVQDSLARALYGKNQLPTKAFPLLIFTPINLPVIESSLIKSNKDLYLRTNKEINKMVKMMDLQIISMSEINSFKLATIYQCKCKTQKLYNYLLDGQPRRLVRCRCCSAPMEENIEQRICAKRCSVYLRKKKDNQARLTPLQVNFISINDNLPHERIQLGCHIEQVDGVTTKYELSNGTWTIGIEALNFQVRSLTLPPRQEMNLNLLSDGLIALKTEAEQLSSFSLGLKLCDIFAPSVAKGGHFRLKMGILLSLLNLSSTEVREKSFLAVGDDPGVIRNILEFSSKFAEHISCYSPTLPMSAVSRKVGSTYWNDSGFIQLASGGIGIVSLDKVWKKDDDHLLFLVKENKVKILMADERYDSVREVPTNIAIWAYQPNDSIEKQCKMKYPALVNAFPMVYEAEKKPLLGDQRNSSELGKDEWKKFFNASTLYSPEFTPEAKKFLRNYFLAARLDRGSSCDKLFFSSLLSLASSLAKLCCRNFVIGCDATLAIIFYEGSLTTKYDKSGLDLPELNLDLDALMGPEARRTLQQYEKKISDYIELMGVNAEQEERLEE